MIRIVLVLIAILILTPDSYAANYALEFGGSGDYASDGKWVSVPDSNNWAFGEDDFTIEAWVNIISLGITHHGVWGQTLPSNNRAVFVVDNHGGMYYEVVSEYTTQAYASGFTAGQWQHIAVSKNDDNINMYINGESKTVNISGPPMKIPNFSATPIIGARSAHAEKIYFLNGMIDELRIWNYSRSQQQLMDWMNYEPVGNEPGLIGYWNFNEGSGQVLHDLTSYANNGQLGYGPGIDINDPIWVASDSPVKVIPEPATMVLFSLGGVVAILIKRRKV